MLDDTPVVIDRDSHVVEPPDLWERYLEPRYRDRAVKVLDVDGGEHLVADGHVILPGGLAGLGGADIEPRSRLRTESTLRYLDGCPPATYEPIRRSMRPRSSGTRSPTSPGSVSAGSSARTLSLFGSS